MAGVVGSFAYNVTMTQGTGALAHPLTITDAPMRRLPWMMMMAALAHAEPMLAYMSPMRRTFIDEPS